MRKQFIISVLIMFGLMGAGLFLTADPAAKDYKVIKKAMKDKQSKSENLYFRLEVTNKKTKDSKVKIKLPIALIDALADVCPNDTLNLKSKCKLDLKSILKTLKSCKGESLIEVEDGNELVRIWIE